MISSLDNSQLAAISRLFSPAVVHEMAKTGRSKMFVRLARESSLLSRAELNGNIGKFFDSAFSCLTKKAHRYEYAYKSAITHKLLLGVHSLRTASMLSEFRVKNCKADLVILNGTSTVYEIKSERDNLERLTNQINSYKKVFAKVNIITGENHADAVLNIIPANVGVLLLNDRFKITTLREAKATPEEVDPICVFESLTKQEAIKIVETIGGSIPDVPNTRFHHAMSEIFSTLSPVDLHRCMIHVLKGTRSLQPLSDLVTALPKSLQAAAITIPLQPRDHINLLNAIDTPLSEALTWA